MNTAAKKRIEISVLHLIVYLFFYLTGILLFLAFRSAFFLITIILSTLLVPFSFYIAWCITEYIDQKILIENELVRRGDETKIIFSITNHSWLCALRGTWLLTIGNSFYQTFDSQQLLLSVPPHGKKQYEMTVTLTNLGRIVFAYKEFLIKDFLSIFTIRTDCNTERDLFVLPQPNALLPDALPDIYSGAAEFAESQRKGNDYSEISDIRTYMLGDRPRDIHWKLSARQPELMVKERVSLSGSEHVLLLELPDEKKLAEKLLTESYHKIKALLDNHITVRLLVWNNRQFAFENYSCTCTEELETAFCEIFHTDLITHSSDLLKQYMKNCYPQLESYLHVTQLDDSIQLEICVNG